MDTRWTNVKRASINQWSKMSLRQVRLFYQTRLKPYKDLLSLAWF